MRFKKKKKIEKWVWLYCTYVWKREDLWRIVLFEWKIVEDLWDEVKCEMIDKRIHVNDDKFFVNLPKKKIKLMK